MAWRHIDSWRPAAEALGLEFDGPLLVKLPTGCAPIDLRLRGFGGAKGTLIVADYEAIRSHREAILAAGFAYSVFDVGAEGAYRSREDILDLLRDWTWTGAPEDRPVWLDKTP